MAVDTGAPVSAVDPGIANNLHLLQRNIAPGAFLDIAGERFTRAATVRDLGLGMTHASNVQMLVWPSPMVKDGHIGGTLAADLLRHYDVDIDFANRKLNLFSQNHCPGKVVYWTTGNIAVIPIRVVKSGHISVPVTLDGQPFQALLDTGSSLSILSMESAGDVFHLKETSPDMERVSDDEGPGTLPVYRHTFKSLALEGLLIGNPAIDIFQFHPNAPWWGSHINGDDESFGATNLILGLHELHHLHLYIAYDEQKLYVSPAPAPAVDATAASDTVPAAATSVH